MIYPIIEDGAKIYAGVKIIDGIRVVKNAIVGTNSVVNIDIPENTTDVGIPSKILSVQ